MALPGAELVRHLQHPLGNTGIDGFASLSLVNQAGGWLLGSHPWKFLERPPIRLDLRGQITVTAGTWTEATRTLLVTAPANAFADYVLLPGDQFQVTAGTGADFPSYIDVLSKTDTTLVLRTSLGADADGETDINGILTPTASRLPADIQELMSVQREGFGNQSYEPVTPEVYTNLNASGGFYATITYGQSVAALGGAPTPRLELSPNPSVAQRSAVTVQYRAGWQKYTTDDQALSNTPDWFDPLLIQAVRAYGKGIQMDSMDVEQGRVKASTLYSDTQRRDGMIYSKRGRMRGGAVRRHLGHGNPLIGDWDIRLPT